MRLDGLEHPKVLELAARLGVSRPAAIGHLELLWAFVGKLAPQGNVGKYGDGAIAGAALWDGNAAYFVDVLLITRLFDECGTHRLLVHDWADHCPSWVRAKLKKAHLPIITTATPPREPTRVATIEATLMASPRARAFPSEAKRREAYPRLATATATIHATAVGAPAPTDSAPPARAPDWDYVGKVPGTIGDGERMRAFDAIRAAYPKKSGRGHNWILAERAWGKLIDEGTTDVATLHKAVERYAAFVTGGGVSSDAYVLGADQFFGAVDSPWQQTWELPTQLRSGSGRKTFDDYQRALAPTADDNDTEDL